MATFLDSMTTKSSKSLEEKTSNGCQKDKESKEQTVAIKDKISNNQSANDVPENTDDDKIEQSVNSNVNDEGEDEGEDIPGNVVNGTSCVDKGGVSEEGPHTDDDQNVVPYEFLQAERDKLYQELQDMKQMENSFQEIAKRLENKCLHQQEELDRLEEKLTQEITRGDTAQQELNIKLKELAESMKNEETLMGRISLLDQERMKLLDEQVTIDRQRRENAKELEKAQALVKSQKAELSKLKTTNEKNDSLISDQKCELSKLKEEVSSLNIKLKWAQNKLKTETETHKETKSQLTATTKKLQQAKEESVQIRQDMKQMISQYQDSEEMRSNSLDVKLRKTEEELRQQEQEIVDQQQLHELTMKDLELNQASLELAQKECQQLKNRVSELTNQITEKQGELDEARLEIAKEKKEQKRLLNEITAMQDMNKDIEKERQAHSALRESHAHLQKTAQHLEREVGRRKDKEAELLGFSEKLSSSNAQLTTEKESLEAQIALLEEELTVQKQQLKESLDKFNELDKSLLELQQSSQREISSLMQSLQDKSKAVEQLTISLEEEREQIVALKRKHSNNIKDMQRQVQLYSKRIEQLEAGNQSDIATLPVSQPSSHSNPMGLRSVSHGSLDEPCNNVRVATLPTNRVPSPDELSSSPISQINSHDPSSELFQTLDHEKTVLVEKMCQLKRQLARREEKLGFYEGHCQQLTDDIKKKSRLIQHYIMREEAGALIPPEADVNKVQLSRRSGIMASVFSGSSQKPSSEMTLDLSLEINRKMQAVLEDTILKNITLKESLDTLGQEVARLSSQLQTFQKVTTSNHSFR